jgi:4'-phosphopantetheinyl transferase
MKMEVKVYQSDFSSHNSDQYLAFLSESERARAEGYLVQQEKSRFVIRRGVLRTLLGRELGQDPREVTIRVGAWGKPEVEGIHFSLSSSGGKMVLALSRDDLLGVDIEMEGSLTDLDGIGELLFSYQEKYVVASMLPQEKLSYARGVWVKKEAWLKGVGCGLSGDLTAYDTEKTPWRFTPLAVGAGFVAFLATTKEVSLCQQQQL